jgi:hypothetical protein
LTNLLARISLIAAGALLVGNQFVSPGIHGWLSALPLLLGGAAFALLQFRLRPPGVTLWKRLLLAAAFVGWGVDELLPAGRIALFLGDAVIAAYVLDLFWMSGDQKSAARSE